MRLALGLFALLIVLFAATGVSAAGSYHAAAGLLLSGYLTYQQACTASGVGVTTNPLTITQKIPMPSEATSIAMAVIALSLAIDVVAIGYMASRVFPATGLKNWLNNEYYEIAKSALLIASIYAVITLISSFAVIVSGASPSGTYLPNIGTLISSAEVYLCNIGSVQVQPAWDFIGAESMGIGIFQGMTVGLWIPIPLPLIPPDGGSALLSGFTMRIYQNFMLESGDIIIQHFESMIYDLTQYVLFPLTTMDGVLISELPLLVTVGLTVMIPLGLVMRAFPVIRGVGGTLIAMGLAMSVMYPATLVLLNLPVTNWANSLFYQQAGGGSASVNGGVLCTMASVISNTNIVSSSTALPPGAARLIRCGSASLPKSSTAFVLYYGFEAFNGMYPFINDVLQFGFYSIVQFLLFVLDLMILYPLTDNVAKALGGTIRLNLGGKLKLA